MSSFMNSYALVFHRFSPTTLEAMAKVWDVRPYVGSAGTVGDYMVALGDSIKTAVDVDVIYKKAADIIRAGESVWTQRHKVNSKLAKGEVSYLRLLLGPNPNNNEYRLIYGLKQLAGNQDYFLIAESDYVGIDCDNLISAVKSMSSATDVVSFTSMFESTEVNYKIKRSLDEYLTLGERAFPIPHDRAIKKCSDLIHRLSGEIYLGDMYLITSRP